MCKLLALRWTSARAPEPTWQEGGASIATHVWCEHPGAGTAKALGPESPSPSPPEQPLGGGSAILSTSCPAGPLPTAIRGVALRQAGQVACRPGVGQEPNYVSEGQPGSANSSCRAGDPLQGAWTLQGDSGSIAFSFLLPRPQDGWGLTARLPWFPLVGHQARRSAPRAPPYHCSLAPGTVAALRSSPLLLPMLRPLSSQ